MKFFNVRFWLWFALTAASIFGIWAKPGWLIATFRTAPEPDAHMIRDSKVATDPDSALASLFTGLAFAGVIAALLLQEAQLKRQAEDSAQQNKKTERRIHEQQEQLDFLKLSCYLNALGNVVAS